jgi:antitoxin HicB
MVDALRYAIAIVPIDEADGGGFLGFVPDLPGCMSDGASREEALTNTEEALLEWIEVQLGRGVDIPQPGSAAADAQRREHALLDAVRSLADYRDHADGKIAELERKLRELIAILKDDRGHLTTRFAIATIGSDTKRRFHS